MSRTKVINCLRRGLDEIGLLGLDENGKSVYPFSMSRKKWQALALGMAVSVEMGFTFVKAAQDARNAQFAEIQKELVACQAALKKDPRSGIPFCGNLKAPKTISRFICQNGFYSYAKPVEKSRLKSAVAAWVLRTGPDNSLLKAQKGRGNLAELMVVIADPSAAKKLADACQGGTVQGFKAKPCKKWDGGDIAGWVSGFISALADNAHYFYLVDVGTASSKTLKSIEKGSQNSSPFGAQTGPRANTGVSRSFGVEQLYQDGAVTGWVVTNSATGAGRWISVKYFTSRDPQTHQLIQQVGVFDYTENPAEIYGRRYAVGSGAKDVDADNLDLVPNRSQFHLTIKNGEVTVSAAGSSQPAIKTNIQNLKQLRLAQVNKEGYDEKIGNQTYKVIGQGGAKGALLFFKEDNKGQVSDFDPVAMAEVNQMTDNGVQDLPATPYNTYLGFFDTGAGGAAQFWYMRRVNNGDMSYFQPVPCQEKDAKEVGEKCKWPPAPEKPKSNGGQSSNQGQGGGNSGTVVAAGDCSEYTNFKNPITKDGISFVPDKDSDSLIICADGNEVAVDGLLMSAEKKAGSLVLQVATPETLANSKAPKPDYKDIYKGSLQSSPVSKHGDRGDDLSQNFATVYGIPITNIDEYSFTSMTLEHLPKTGNIPRASKSADMNERMDVSVDKKGGIHHAIVSISASSQENAESAWGNYEKDPHYRQILDFLKSEKCAQGSNTERYITINPLLSSEINTAGADSVIASCGSAHLTAGELLKGTAASP